MVSAPMMAAMPVKSSASTSCTTAPAFFSASFLQASGGQAAMSGFQRGQRLVHRREGCLHAERDPGVGQQLAAAGACAREDDLEGLPGFGRFAGFAFAPDLARVCRVGSGHPDAFGYGFGALLLLAHARSCSVSFPLLSPASSGAGYGFRAVCTAAMPPR